jgi:hypothetical protein
MLSSCSDRISIPGAGVYRLLDGSAASTRGRELSGGLQVYKPHAHSNNRGMPKKLGTIGVALTAWDLWRRLPPKQRQLLLAQAKLHGPRLAKKAYAASRKPRI